MTLRKMPGGQAAGKMSAFQITAVRVCVCIHIRLPGMQE